MSHFDTLAVHAGEEPDPETGALRTPLHMSTTLQAAPLRDQAVRRADDGLGPAAVRLHALEQSHGARARRPAGRARRCGGRPGRGDRHGRDLGAGAHLPQQRRSPHRQRGVLRGRGGAVRAAPPALRHRGQPGGHERPRSGPGRAAPQHAHRVRRDAGQSDPAHCGHRRAGRDRPRRGRAAGRGLDLGRADACSVRWRWARTTSSTA